MTIVFDFKGTLYNPRTRRLYKGWEILKKLKSKDEIWLWSTGDEDWNRVLCRLRISELFDRKIFPKMKSEGDFACMRLSKRDYLVSDSLNDIRIGNETGFQTIWVKRSRKTTNASIRPKYVANSLLRIYRIVNPTRF